MYMYSLLDLDYWLPQFPLFAIAGSILCPVLVTVDLFLSDLISLAHEQIRAMRVRIRDLAGC